MLSEVIHLLASVINFLLKGWLEAGLQRVFGTCLGLFSSSLYNQIKTFPTFVFFLPLCLLPSVSVVFEQATVAFKLLKLS